MYIFLYTCTYISSTTFGSRGSCFWDLKPVFHDKRGTLCGRHSWILHSVGTLEKSSSAAIIIVTRRRLTTGTSKSCTCWLFCSLRKYFALCIKYKYFGREFCLRELLFSQRLNLNSQTKTQDISLLLAFNFGFSSRPLLNALRVGR